MENIKQPVWCQAGTRHAIKQIKISWRKSSLSSGEANQLGFLPWQGLEPDTSEKNLLEPLQWQALRLLLKADSSELI